MVGRFLSFAGKSEANNSIIRTLKALQAVCTEEGGNKGIIVADKLFNQEFQNILMESLKIQLQKEENDRQKLISY